MTGTGSAFKLIDEECIKRLTRSTRTVCDVLDVYRVGVYEGTDLSSESNPFPHPTRQQPTFSLSSECRVRCILIFVFVERLQRYNVDSSSTVKGYSENFEAKFDGSVPLECILRNAPRQRWADTSPLEHARLFDASIKTVIDILTSTWHSLAFWNQDNPQTVSW